MQSGAHRSSLSRPAHLLRRLVLPPHVTAALLLFPLGLFAGAMNVIAGGGSLLTLPAMIFLGLPATVANGTNRVALLVQNAGAAASFHRRGFVSKAWIVLAVPPTLVGVVLGAGGAVYVTDALFQRILAVVLVLAAAWTVWNPLRPPADGDVPPPRGAARLGLVAGFFFVGVFGGFIQAGVGFIILALASAAGLDLVHGNALKVPLVLAFNLLALPFFAAKGMVAWLPGLSLGAGTLLGALFGIRLQIAKGHAWVRRVVTVTIVGFAVALLARS